MRSRLIAVLVWLAATSGCGSEPVRKLFDIENEPEERHDVASAHPERVTEFSRELGRVLLEAFGPRYSGPRRRE